MRAKSKYKIRLGKNCSYTSNKQIKQKELDIILYTGKDEIYTRQTMGSTCIDNSRHTIHFSGYFISVSPQKYCLVFLCHVTGSF